ncbi:fibrinogen-like protein 1 [Branchiostoma floridae]|uniref:Fibrinogen-like protein 1 n=1 Tax=Branchiostoma floridae TaxID=7739 RepID=A0A9J7KKY6_BRAFL|nr:fibrinogen-like protein 1 [Branchiostoma floridae]
MSPSRVSGESNGYRLHISGYSGTAGDSMTGLSSNNGQRFSTVDRDNDAYRGVHCSQQLGEAGWWFEACGLSYLNGRYLGNCGYSCLYLQGVVWYPWRNGRYSLKSVSMKIRPAANPQVTPEAPQVTPEVTPVVTTTTAPPTEVDCSALHASGQTTSGVYTLTSGVQAYCDMETAGGGWTVIQRRQDGSVPFNRTWEEYKLGFGNLSGEYWLGNDNIHLLTSQTDYTLRVDLVDYSGFDLYNTAYEEYSSFRVSSESDQYRLHISGYSGTAGNSMRTNDGWWFSTLDRDNDIDRLHCSQWHGQAGWWFRGYKCTDSNLNGRYLGDCVGYWCQVLEGMFWYTWRHRIRSLKASSMKIRPN